MFDYAPIRTDPGADGAHAERQEQRHAAPPWFQAPPPPRLNLVRNSLT